MVRQLLCAVLCALPAIAVAQDVVTVALQKQTAGTFYVDGALQGYGELALLVDTGSSYMVISERILERLKAAGQAKFSRELEGMMADGSRRVVPMYRIASLRLGPECWLEDIEAAVFPGDARPILGMNVLGRLAPFTFSAEPPQLALHRCEALTPAERILTKAEPAPTPLHVQ